MKFKQGKTYRQRKTILLASAVIAAVLLIACVAVVRKAYTDNLRPISTTKKAYVVTIEQGSTAPEIAQLLQSKGVIRSDWAFEWYVRNHELRDELKAGTYVLYGTQSVGQIVDILVEGKVATDLVTILPAKRLSQIREAFLKAGFKPEDVDKALEPSQYAGHPALTDKPKAASLEGYLYPESFQKTAQTTPQQLIKKSLDEMNLRLTPNLRQAISKQGMTLHQGIILASLIEKEVGKPEDRAQVSQVFHKRLHENIRLESDATNEYAKLNPAYNSYQNPGLPPGPISNVSESSLNAVAFPAQTDWLYFVSGDDGRTHFSKTLEEHQQLTRKYCTKLCR